MTAPTDAERAREIILGLPLWKMIDDEIDADVVEAVIKGVESALASVRAEERERAARIAETFVDACDARTAREIADEIRAGEKH